MPLLGAPCALLVRTIFLYSRFWCPKPSLGLKKAGDYLRGHINGVEDIGQLSARICAPNSQHTIVEVADGRRDSAEQIDQIRFRGRVRGAFQGLELGVENLVSRIGLEQRLR